MIEILLRGKGPGVGRRTWCLVVEMVVVEKERKVGK